MQKTQMEKNDSNNAKRRLIILVLLVIFLFIGAGWFAWWYWVGQFKQNTDDAYVAGNQVQVTPRTEGTVTQIYTDDTQFVHQGQKLVIFDDTDQIIALHQAEAHLADIVRQVVHLKANVKQLRYLVDERRIAVQKAQQDFNRRKGLLAIHAISNEEFMHAKDALGSAKASLEQSIQQLVSVQAVVTTGPIYNDPKVKLAIQGVRLAFVNLGRTQVIAPVSGVIARRQVQVGQRVSAGVPLMVIIPMNQLWVDANFKESQLADVRIGQPVKLESDVYGKHYIFHGSVEGIDAGTGSVFSLLPAQNATGNWIKVVQRVPVRIALAANELKNHPLRIGLSMNVTIDTHDRSGPLLAYAKSGVPQYSTGIFKADDMVVDKVIREIIAKNKKAG
ncbi:MAG: HlyD family efflux transporter periplasmic adaptor subunit [Pseudomonadota bacterium]|nr:HlyD family efflux transporter periplasmic adaptor subunit [Pseudomonadota bacterium]